MSLAYAYPECDHYNSVAATGGGLGAPASMPQEESVAAIIDEALIARVLPACEGDSDIHPDNLETEESGTRETQEEGEDPLWPASPRQGIERALDRLRHMPPLLRDVRLAVSSPMLC
ncbi:hypothetical protein UPYG_G00308920 [Umbra pygmaea]|uniref:Uncharacterized protein n=1 Tax=Umbra pygmaea TaxID=75934 RepID=A0ABD0W3I3_UMBPY